MSKSDSLPLIFPKLFSRFAGFQSWEKLTPTWNR